MSRRTVIRLAQAGRISQDKRGRVLLREVQGAARPRCANPSLSHSIDEYVKAEPGTLTLVGADEVQGLRARVLAADAMVVNLLKNYRKHYTEKRKVLSSILAAIDKGQGHDSIVLSRRQLAAIDCPED